MTVKGRRVLAHLVVVVAHCDSCDARQKIDAGDLADWSSHHLQPHVSSVPVAVQCSGPGCPRC